MKKYRNFIPPVTLPITIAQNSGIVPDVNADAQEDGKVWDFFDKILGFTQRCTDIYTQIKTGEKPIPYGPDYQPHVDPEKDWTGMRKPWGTIIVIGVVSVVGVAIFKMSK